MSEPGKPAKGRSIAPHWLLAGLPLILCLVAATLLRCTLHSDLIEDRDGILFLRAMDDYSVLESRPHWPGYPVYIWLGKGLTWLWGEPVKALHLLSSLATSLAALPLGLLVRDWARALGSRHDHSGTWAALVTCLLWSVVPITWLDGTEIFSDPSGIACALTMLLCCSRAIMPAEPPPPGMARQGDGSRYVLLAAGLGGCLLGIRLSYALLLLPLADVSWRLRWRWTGAESRAPRLLLAAWGTFALACFGWLGWQWYMDGSGYLEAAHRHLVGHFSQWGGSVRTDEEPCQRPLRLLHTLLVYGLGGYWPGLSGWRLLPTLGGTMLAGSGLRLLWQGSSHEPGRLLAAWSIPYLSWIFLSHDVDLARYTFPLVASCLMLAGLGIGQAKRTDLCLAGLTILPLAIITAPLVLTHRHSPLLEHQLAAQLSRRQADPRIALLVKENLPMVQYLAPQVRLVPLGTQKPNDLAFALRHRRFEVYATSEVLETTAIQSGSWAAVDRVCQTPLMRSRGAQEWLIYRYQPGAGFQSPLPCSSP